MKSVLLGLFLALFLFPVAHALQIQDYSIVFDIQSDTSVREYINITFEGPLNQSTLNYIIVGDFLDLRIKSGEENIDYVLEKSGNEHNVRFVVPKGTQILQINFIAKDLVFAKENIYSLFASLQPPSSHNVNVIAFLPKGFAVYRDVVYPVGYEILTDGERIYLKWNFSNPEDIMISFKFYNTHSDYSLAIMIVMGLAIIVLAVYLVTHYRKKVESEFLKGFSEDERKVLSILSERKVCMQNKIERELGFSRAKMTRVVKKLEGKDLLEKERIGRTNRLFFKK